MKHFLQHTLPTSAAPYAAALSVALLLTLPAFVQGAEEHDDHAGEDHAEGVIELTPEQAQTNGIGIRQAGPGLLQQTVLLYGKTVPDPEQVSHVSARYPGQIQHIGASLGDTVEAGAVVAVIEASSSLQTYQVLAPIGGTVVDKHANPGEITGEEPLLTIANYSRMWVALSVFPADTLQVRPGQEVRITANRLSTRSEIRYLNPGEAGSPTITARVPLSNAGLAWTPGLLVEGHVTVAETEVDVLIENRALQTFEGRQGVFVKEDSRYEFTPLVLGESNGHFTAVLDGLDPGDMYVVENSYLLKADLEKSGATHAH